MSDSVDLGTIWAGVGLKLDGLKAGQIQATTELRVISQEMAKMAAAAESAEKRVATAAQNKALQQNLKTQEKALQEAAEAQKHFAQVSASALGGVAAGVALAGVAVVKMAGDFDASMTKIANNTTMTAGDIAKMKAAVLSMGKESGASFDDLAEGFAHITNFGFKAADATIILHEAMKSAVATGTSTADTADVLAKALHEFGLRASDAGKAMNVMHLAAAQGNMTLQQFDDAAGPAMAQAANLGVSLTDVSAAMSALTRHGLDASESATQVKDILVHMINPSKSAREELERLTKTTGVDLVGDFSLAGLKAKGFTGVMDDLKKATSGNGQEIYKLIQAQRGGLGAMILAGNGAKDYHDILSSLSDAMSGKVDPTTVAYQRSLRTLNNEIARVTNEIKADFIPAGEKLTPVFEDAIPLIRTTAHLLGDLLDGFSKLPKPIQETILAVGGLTLGVKALSLAIGTSGGVGLLGGLGGVAEKLGMKIAPGTVGAFLLRGVGALPVAGVLGAGALAAAMVTDATKTNRTPLGADGNPIIGAANPSAQIKLNQDAAFKIKDSDEWRNLPAQIAAAKADLAKVKAGGAKAFEGGGMTVFGAEQAYASALKNAAAAVQTLTARRSAIHHDYNSLMGDASLMQRTASPGGNSIVAEAMAKHIGEATGIQCGAAVTKALKEGGFTGTASALARAAIANKSLQLQPDAQGHLPPGTIVFFPGKGGSVGKDPTEHFGVMGGVNPYGQQPVLESTTAGGRGRHYQDSRTLAQIAAEHGGRYFAFSPGNTSGKGEPQPQTTEEAAALTDLRQRAYEANHTDFQNQRYEAKEQYSKDKATDPALAKSTYLASLKKIDADEEKEQAGHHQKIESAAEHHLKRMQAIQADTLKSEAQATVRVQKAGAVAAQARADAQDQLTALQDPDGHAFAGERAVIKRTYQQRMKDAGASTLGPYSQQQLGDFALAGQTRDASLADVDSREKTKSGEAASKAADEASEYAKQAAADTTQLNREVWLHAGGDMSAYFASLRKDADDALIDVQRKYGVKSAAPNPDAVSAAQDEHTAQYSVIAQQQVDAQKEAKDKIERGQEESARFEFQQHMLSLSQYRAILQQKLAVTQQYETGSTTVLTAEYMRLKEAYDESMGESKAKVIDVGQTIQSTFESRIEKSIGHFHSMKSEWKSLTKDMLTMAIEMMAKISALWLTSNLFKGAPSLSFGGGTGGTGGSGGNPFAAVAGILGKQDSAAAGSASSPFSDPGMSAGNGAMAGFQQAMSMWSATQGGGAAAGAGGLGAGGGGLSGLSGLLGQGGAMGGIGAALPWVAAGLAIHKLAPGLLGKVFGGWLGQLKPFKKLFHFNKGGFVPGSGFTDSVPAMLTPGERVLTREQAKGSIQPGGAPPITINHYGDNHNAGDVDAMHSDWAWGVSQHLATAVPGN